jgi:Na+/melibiose symporter-like transporter
VIAGGVNGRVRASLLAWYALPAFALAMPTIPAYVYLPTFYAENLGVGLAATGWVLLLARIFDVVTDPLIGVLSDRFSSPWGRRKPWVLAGAILAGIALLQLFRPPDDVGAGFLLAWVTVLFLGWTMVAVPYTAWGAELSADYHERARISGAREALMVVGVLAAGAVPAAAAYLGRAERDGLAAVAWLAIVTGLPAIALLLWRVPEAPPRPRPDRMPATRSWPREIRSILGNGPFVRLLSGWFVNGLANGLPAVLFPLYLQYGLQADAVTRGVLIMLYFLAGVLAIPVWVRLSRRWGKHRVWCLAMMLACAAFIWVPLLPPGAVFAFAVICVMTGVAFGADIALPPAMQADVVDLDSLRTRRQRAGLFFALWSMSTKLALALAVGIAFPLLELFGFQGAGENTPGALLALAVIYALVPTVLKILAIAVIWHHPLTARRQEIIRRRLDTVERRSRES